MPIQTAIDSISNNQGSPFGFKNRLINGAMVIDQRNNGGSVTVPLNGANAVDRWQGYHSQASKFTIQQNQGSVTPPIGFSNYFGATSTSAYTSLSSDEFQFTQGIEGRNVADFEWGTVNAQPVTLSFWVRSSLTGTFAVSIVSNASTRSYPATYTINQANTWEYKSITIPGDTTGTWPKDNSFSIGIRFVLGYGSNFVGTGNEWNAGNKLAPSGAVNLVSVNGATWYATGIQFEKGTQSTSFDYRPFGTELQLCQRYFQKSFAYNKVPSAANASFNCAVPNGSDVFDGYSRASFNFNVSMRAAPTITTYSGSTTGQVRYQRNTGATVDGAHGGIAPINEYSFVLNGNYGGSGSNTDIRSVNFDYIADAEI